MTLVNDSSDMAVFSHVVAVGSFSAAARELAVTPSAVSKQIARLERRLGVRLFHRSSRRLSLTAPGREFHTRAVAILAAIRDAEDTVSELERAVSGTLRVSGTVAFCRTQILPLLPAFLERHPDLRLEFELSDRRLDLPAEEIDLAIRVGEQLDNPDVVSRRLADFRRIICAAPGYLERHGTPRTPAELRDHNCLTLYTSARFNDWSFDGELGSEHLPVSGSFAANSIDALYQAALAGLGLARLSTFLVAEDLGAGRLVRVLPGHMHEHAAIYLLYPGRLGPPARSRAFVDFLLERFHPLPPWERSEPARSH